MCELQHDARAPTHRWRSCKSSNTPCMRSYIFCKNSHTCLFSSPWCTERCHNIGHGHISSQISMVFCQSNFDELWEWHKIGHGGIISGTATDWVTFPWSRYPWESDWKYYKITPVKSQWVIFLIKILLSQKTIEI